MLLAATLQVTLSPHDLFHGHIFHNQELDACGMLFHCMEYPAYHAETFPFNLGFCQENSTLHVKSDRDLEGRCVLLFDGRLVFIDVASVAQELLWEETRELCTVYEQDFGTPVADVYCYRTNENGGVKVFVCPMTDVDA